MIDKIRISNFRLEINIDLEFDSKTYDILYEICQEDLGKFYISYEHVPTDDPMNFTLIFLTRDRKIVIFTEEDAKNINYNNFTKKLMNNEIVTREEIIQYLTFLSL